MERKEIIAILTTAIQEIKQNNGEGLAKIIDLNDALITEELKEKANELDTAGNEI